MSSKILFVFYFVIIAYTGFSQVPNAPIVQINSGNPKFPFPRFVEYGAGKNLALYNPEGVVHAEMEQDIRDAYQIMMNRARVESISLSGTPYITFNNFVQHPDLRGGYGTFVTEGDGYALIAAAYMADKKTFDGLWMWAHDFRLTHAKRYIDCTDMRNTYYFGRYAELWNVYTTGVSNEDRATDGTVDYAIALLMAYRQWGEHSGIIDACGNEINYKTEALKFINSMVEPFLNTDRADAMKYYMMGVVGLDGYMKSGNKWIELTDWAQGTLQTIMTGIGVSMAGTGVDPTGLSANVHWINGRTVTRDFFDYHASGYFKEFGDFLQEIYNEGNAAYVTTEFNIAQCRRAEASTDWLMQKANEQNLIPYIGGVSACANDGSTVTFQQVGEGEDFRLPMRTITNYIWHGTPNYKWDPVTHKVIAGTQTSELTAATKLCTFLWAPGNNCETLGSDPTGTKIKYTGVTVLRQAYNMNGTAMDSYYTNYTLGSSVTGPVATGDTELAAKMYRQLNIEWDVEESLAEALADPTKRYLKSTPKYFHGYYRNFGLLMLTGNYIAPSNAAPVANLKCYLDINKTYGPVGDVLTYTVSYRNYASVAAQNSVLVFNVPTQVQYISCQGGGVYNSATRTVTWNLNTIPGFVTGGLAATKGEFNVVTKVTATTGRICTTSTITCSNGTGWTSNEYPNNITATMERNCYDIVAKSLEVIKTSNLDQINPDMFVEYTVNFKNNSSAGYLDGGRPGTRATFAEGFSGLPNDSREQQLYFRLYHAADEPYINYANYRLSYYAKSDTRGIATALGQDGWFIKSWIDEGGPLVTQWDEIILPFGHPAQNSVNQRIIIGFPSALAAPAAHLYNQTGNDHRIHKGVNFPLKLSASITDGHSVNQNYSDDWSYSPTVNLGGQTLDKEIFYPVTPDWTDPVNFPAGQAVNTWHTEECRTTSTTFDKVLIEEFDGYGWRRIFGTSPLPGRPATDVVMVDTIPSQFTFDSFIQTASFGTTQVITSGGYSIVKWTNSSFLPGQDLTIKYKVKAKSEAALGGCPLNIDTENIAYLYSIGEAAQSDTAIVNITCDVITIPPTGTTMTKTADKANYTVNENIQYTINFQQTVGTTSKPNLNSSTGWTTRYARPMPVFGSNKITFNDQSPIGQNFITNNYAHGKDGNLTVNFTRTNVSESFSFFLRYDPTSTNVPGTAGFKGISVSVTPASNWMGLGLLCNDGATKLNPIYGSEDQISVSVTTMNISFLIRNDSLMVWLNKDMVLTPTVIYRVTTLTPGYAGIYGGKNGGSSYVNGTINSWDSHFDSAFDLQITDPIPSGLSFVSATNSGTNTANIVSWPLQAGPVLKGTTYTYTWIGKLNTCPATGKIINTAYVNIYGQVANSIGAQNTVTCGGSCPSAPTVTTPVNYCKGATTTALTATGTSLKWYTVATGGTSSTTAPTPITTSAGTTSYYVTQTSNGCESPRAQIDVIITETASPTVTTPINYCLNATATALTATGTSLKWYTIATGGSSSTTAPTPITTTAGTTIYYVSQTLNSCESSRAAISVIVSALPSVPTITTPINYCQNATASVLTATGTNLLWYTAATGGIGNPTAPTPTTTTAGTTIYYVSQTVGSCESPRAAISVVVTALPTAPTVTTPVNYCQNTTATALTATGTNLKWYTVATGGASSTTAPTPITTTAGTTIYYVSQTVGSCESPRAAISVVVTALPTTPTVTTPINYCQNATATALTATGTNLLWYTVATAGISSTTAPTPITTTAGTTLYYVSQSISSCESPRATISVVVTALPTAPTVTTPINYCQNATASALTATGTGLLWYTVATGGLGSNTAPTPITTTAGTTLYYVSQTVGSCESPRAAISVVITALPIAPIVTTPVNFCQNAIATALSATGTGLLWYTTATGGVGVSTAPTPITTSTGTTLYYVSQTIGSCESPRAPISVEITALPTTPTITSNSPICAATALNLTTAAVTGATYAWSGPSGFTSALQNPTIALPTTAESGTYSLTVTVNSCTSAAGTTSVTINPIPATPTASNNSPICEGATLNLTTPNVTGASFAWTGPNGFISTLQNPSITAATTAAAGIYSVTVTSSGCASIAGTTTVVINPIPNTPAASSNSPICEGTTLNLSTPAVTGATYSWTGPNSFSSALQNPSITSATIAASGTYNLTVSVNSCTSAAGSTVVVINPIPATPTVSSNSPICAATALNLTTTAVSGATYSWSGPSGFTSALQNPSIASPTTAESGTYNLTVTVNGCTSAAGSTAVTINSIPATPTASNNGPICEGSTLNLSTPAISGATYIWTGPNSFTSTLQNPTIVSATTAASGTYNVTVSVSGCTSLAGTTTATINAIPATPTASSNSPICEGSALNLSTPAVTGAIYSWTGPNSFTSALQNPTIAAATIAASGTYNVTVSVSGCTSAAGSTVVTVNLIPTITINPVAPLCVDASAVTLSASATPLSGTGNFSGTGVTGNSFNPTTAGVGTHIITYTYTVNSCSNSATTNIIVQDKPTVSFTLPATACAGDATLALTGNQTGGTFTVTPSVDISSGFNPATATPNTAYAITYSYSDGVCANTVSHSITVYNPTQPIGANVSEVYTLVPPVPALTASGIGQIWYSDVTLTTQVGTGATYTPSALVVTNGTEGIPGVYTYYVKSTEGGCSSLATPISLTITSCSATVPTPVDAVVEMCFGDANPLHKTLEVTTSGTDIRWYFGGVSQQTGASKTYIPTQTAAGTYTFEVSQYDNTELCESPLATITLIIHALPTVSLTLPAAVCEGSPTIDFTSAKSQAAGIVTCVEAASVCTDFNPTTDGTFNFNYSYTNPTNSCTNTTTAQIIVRPLPIPVISAIPNVCEYDAQFNVMPFVDLTGGTFSGTGIVGTNFNPALVTPGTSPTISYNYTDAFSCSNTVTTTISVIAKPTITFNTIAQSCEDGFVLNLESFVTPNTGTFSGTGVSGVDFTPTIPGSFPITYTLTENGCTNTDIENAIVNPLPTPTITSNAVECKNTGIKTVTLNPLGGTLTIDGTTITDINTATIAAGNYTLEYTYQNPTTLCSNSITAPIEIREIPSPTVSNKTVIIGSTDLAISATGNGGTLTWKDEANATVGTGTSINHTSSAVAGDWDYCVRESDGTCSSAPACMTFTVTNCPTPAPTITPAVHTICNGAAIPSFTATGTGTVNWYDNTNALVYTGATFTPTITAGTTGTFTWTAKLTDGCEGPSTTATLTINPLPTVTISNPAVECINTGNKIPTMSPLGGTLTLDATNITAINTNSLAAGNYTLEYTYQNPTTLCSNNATQAIEIREIPTPTVANKTTLISSPDLTITTTTNNGGTLTWKDEANATVATGASMTHPLAPSLGDWDYCVTESDGTCSSNPACMTFTIIDCPTPAPTITPATATICSGVAIPSFTATGVGTFNWYDNTNTLIFTGSTFTPTITVGATGTFTWTVTATNTCEGPSTPVSLTINPLPNVSLTANTLECINTGIKTPTLTPIGGTLTIDGLVIPSINTNATSAGNHTLVYSYQNPTTLCSNSITAPIEIREIPSPIVSDITKLITDTDLTVSVSSSNGGLLTWKNESNITVGSGTSMTHPLTPSVGDWDYCVTESDGTCSSIPACMTFTIINCPVPAPTIITPSTQACVNEPIPTLAVSGAHTIHWYQKGSSTLLGTGANYTPTITGIGLYEFDVSQNDGTCEGVRASLQLQVIENAVPTILDNNPACENGTKQTLRANVSSGTVNWYLADPASSPITATGNTYSVPDLPAGQHNIWTIHELTCKSEAVKTTIEILPIPAAPTINGNNICPGQNLSFSITGSNVIWYSAGTTTQISTGNSYTITNPPSGLYSIDATYEVNGCVSAIGSKTIEVYNKPAPPTGLNQSICFGETFNDLTVSSTEAFPIFHWYTENTLINEVTTLAYLTPPSDNQSHSYYVTQEVNGCMSNYTPISLIVTPQTPEPSVTLISQYCEGETIQPLVASGRNIEWYLTNSSASLIASGATYTPTYDGIKTYTFYVTQTVNNCISDFGEVTFTVLPKPQIPILSADSNPIITCSNSPQSITATSNAPITWEVNYNTARPRIYSGSLFPEPGTTPIVGTTNVRVYADNGNCRSDKITLQYIVNQQPSTPIISQNVICIGADNFEVEAEGSNIEWINVETGNIVSNTNILDLSDIYIPGKTNYNFNVTQTVNDCRSNILEKTIIMYPLPNPEIIGLDSVCENSNNITYLINNGDALSTFSWNLMGNGILYKPVHSEESVIQVDWLTAGIDTLVLKEVNKYNCTNTTKMPIYVAKAPVAQFEWQNIGDEGYLEITNTTIQEHIIGNGVEIIPQTNSYWNLYDKPDSVMLNNNEKVTGFLRYGYYTATLLVTNDFGCQSSFEDEVFIKTSYGIYVPNAFSPQNPALGVRTFKPVGYHLEKMEIWIFDSWGNIIWYSDKLNSDGMPIEEWDGTYNGELLQSGTYIWKMNITFKDGSIWEGDKDNPSKSNFGSVLLIR